MQYKDKPTISKLLVREHVPRRFRYTSGMQLQVG